MSKKHPFDETAAAMEPLAVTDHMAKTNSMSEVAAVSTAISLKRIADSLEALGKFIRETEKNERDDK